MRDLNRTPVVMAKHGCSCVYSDSKIHGANVGPTWGCQDPGGPHVGHTNLAIWVFFRNLHLQDNLTRDCFTSTASTVNNSVQNIFTLLRYCDK